MRRFLSRISIRLLAFNVLLVLFTAAGASYLAIYERQLLQQQEQSMVQQGRVLAAALSERGPLTQPVVEPILVRLEQRTTSRIRVLDREGWLLSDTSRLGPLRESALAPEEPPGADGSGPRASWLYRFGSGLVRLTGQIVAEPRPPVSAEEFYSADAPFEGAEVRQALAGEYGAATRITPGGQRSVTLYSALPVLNEGDVVGIVLVSQSTFHILQDLYEVRLAVFRFLLGAVALAAVLSLLLSATISRPLSRLRSQAAALLDGRGRLTGRFGSSERLDEIGDLSRALSELYAQLQERMRFIESFAADVSHEFKNPLTSIRAATEMLKDVDDPEERERFARVVERDIARLEKLLSGVREVTRLDATEDVDQEKEPVSLGELLEGISSSDRYRGSAARIELALPEERVQVAASGDRLAQVFENLIDNAVGFSPEGGCVLVSLAAERDWAVARVEDEGPGVPEEHRGRIYDRFFSYRPEDARAKEHSGLGLAIVKAVVERYGGQLALVDSKLGGAAFEVRLRRT